MSVDSEDIAAVRKELLTVKSKAVGKIKALQQQVDVLQQQLAKQPPPEETSSDGSRVSEDGGFVKVPVSPNSDNRESAAQLRAREDEVRRREQALAEREEVLREAELAVAARASAGAGAGAGWHAALLAGLREVHANVAQVNIACETAGL